MPNYLVDGSSPKPRQWSKTNGTLGENLRLGRPFLNNGYGFLLASPRGKLERW